MARKLQQARARAARYDGRAGSASTENTDGGNAITEVNNTDGAKGEEAVGDSRDGRAGEQIITVSDEGDNEAEGAATTGGKCRPR